MNFYSQYFATITDRIHSVEPLVLERATRMLHEVKQKGKKVIIVGNGGSAAIAGHVAIDFVKVANIRAINFNEANLITCFANDYGYENWVEKALDSYADAQDLAILISSSGKSPNILNGALKAKQMGLSLITFSGFSVDNPLRELGDLNFWVDSRAYNVVEMTHHVWLVALVDKLAADQEGAHERP